MPKIIYANIKLEKPYVEKHIDPFIEENEHGFTSRAHFVKDAIKLLERQLKGEKAEVSN